MAVFKALCRATSTLKPRYPILRCMHIVPEEAQTPNQRVTLTHLKEKHSNYREGVLKGDRKGDRITVLTAYDYPSAVHLKRAGIDVCLVGDSASMVVHGHDTTLPISFDEMLVHCRAVARGVNRPLLVDDLPFGTKRPLLVGDLPFGTYESSTNQAVDTAMRVLKEGEMDAVKLEGGSPSRIAAVEAIVSAGIAVMGHVGFTPQDISVLGGFRPQANKFDSAVAFEVVKSAKALEKAGCFSVVLECVPSPVALAATAVIGIPTIGVGAVPFCSGQLLVYHDLLGMLQHPHHAKVTPRFCKQYASVGDVINEALLEYKNVMREVKIGSFRDPFDNPYKINESEFNCFLDKLRNIGEEEEEEKEKEVSETALSTVNQKIDELENLKRGSLWEPSK